MRESDESRWSALMVSAQAGNQGDYRILLQELGDVVHRFLCSRFGRHHFIEDCVQEALVAVHNARHTYDPQRPFRPWLFAIVRHKTIDTLRRQRHQQRIARQSERTTVEAGGSHSDAPEAALVGGRLLEALPTQHREVITLTRIVGLSTAETAARLSISESAVKVRVHRAIAKLKGLLERDAP